MDANEANGAKLVIWIIVIMAVTILGIGAIESLKPTKTTNPTVVVEYWGPGWDPAKKYKTWTKEKEMTRILEKGRYYIKCEVD